MEGPNRHRESNLPSIASLHKCNTVPTWMAETEGLAPSSAESQDTCWLGAEVGFQPRCSDRERGHFKNLLNRCPTL